MLLVCPLPQAFYSNNLVFESLQMDCDRIVVGTRRHKLVALDLETLSPFLATNFNHNIHNHPILTLAFDTHHSNSNILVSGDQLGKLVVWNSLSGQVLGWRDECHSGGISCTAVISSPDIIIVTAGFDKFIRIHQVVKEEEANPTASLQFNQLHINGKDRRSSFSSSTSSSTSKSFLSATTTKTPPSLSPHSSLHSFPSASLSAPTSPFPVRNNNTISTSSLWSTQSSPRKSAFLNRGGSLHRSASIDRNRMAVVASSNETVFVSSSSSPQIISPTSNNKLLSKITKSLKKKSKKLKNKVKRKLFQMSPQKKTAAGNNDTTAAVSTSQNTTSIQPAIALECIQELRGHIGDIYHICILRKEGDHPHGHFLASASLDHSIKIWNTSESQCLRTLRAHRDSVSSLCSLGETLFSAGMDGMVIQWNWMTGSVLRVFPSSPLSSSQSCWVRSIAVRGEYLVCGDSIGYISGKDDDGGEICTEGKLVLIPHQFQFYTNSLELEDE